MSVYKAVIFDLDGTLLDTLADLGNSTNEMLERHGFPPHPLDVYRLFVGDGAKTLVIRALPVKHRVPETIHTCLEDFLQIYSMKWDALSRPYEGISEMLDGLRQHRMKMAVLSNKPDAFTKLCVKKFFPDWKFDAVLGQRDSFPKKPDPSGALEIASLLNIPASAFLYLGDTSIDMKTATSAGMHAVGVLWGFRSKEELIESGARMVIGHPAEILNFL